MCSTSVPGARPKLELKAFQRVHFEPNAVKIVTLGIKARDLAYWDSTKHAWRVEKEPVRILAGGSSHKLPVQAILQINAAGPPCFAGLGAGEVVGAAGQKVVGISNAGRAMGPCSNAGVF